MDFHNTSLDAYEAQQAADDRNRQSLNTDTCWDDFGFRAFWDEVELLLNDHPEPILWILRADGHWRRFWQRISGRTAQKKQWRRSLTDTIRHLRPPMSSSTDLKVWAVDPAHPLLPLIQSQPHHEQL